MGRRAKTGKDRLDRYYHLAKEQGYRARSAFKLIQLAQKFNIFKNCEILVDLCAAPGGWLQVAKRNMGVSSKIIGVDLVAIKGIPGVTTFKCDITTERCKKLIFDELNGIPVDVVLHDGAPNVGTSWDKDAYIQNELVLHSAKLACEILKPNGIFVTKVFRSTDYNSVLWVLSQLFKTVKATKPQSSRNVSAEIFLVCLGYKAPKKIDSRFFDPKYVFQSNKGENEGVDLDSFGNNLNKDHYGDDSDGDSDSDNMDDHENKLLTRKTRKNMKSSLSELIKGIGKRNRDGYEKGDDFRVVSAYDFFHAENPALVLLKSNTINLNPKKADESNTLEREFIDLVLNHPKTTYEIKLLCEDLKVLGKKELMQLLKWRFLVFKDIKSSQSKKDSLQGKENNITDSDDDETELDDNGDADNHENDNIIQESEEEDNCQGEIDQELLDMLKEQRRRNKILEKKKRLQQRKREWRASLSKGGFDVEGNEQDLFKYTKEVAKVLDNEERDVSIDGYFPEGVHFNDNFLLGDDFKISSQEIQDGGNKVRDNSSDESNDSNDEELDHKDLLGIDLDIQDYIKRNKIMQGGDSKLERQKSRLLGQKKETRREKVISDWVEEMNQFSNKIEEENQRVLAKKAFDQIYSSDDDTDFEDDNNNDNKKKNKVSETNKLKSMKDETQELFDYKNDIKKDTLSNRWFSNSVFNDFIGEEKTQNTEDGTIIRELSDSEIPQIPMNEKKLKKLKNKKSQDKNKENSKNNEIEFVPKSAGSININDGIEECFNQNNNDEYDQDQKDMEEEVNFDSVDSDDEDTQDSDSERFTKPENEEELKMIQGIGSLLVNKSTRMDLIDGSYNRYAFHDPAEDLENNVLGLPSWFVEDENKHNKPELPITKDLMAQYKAKLREIKNRPIRKESEALARKKRRYEKIMEKARKKAQSIADSEEMNEASKSKTINNLIKKAQKVSSKKRVNVYTVTRRHGLSKQVKNKDKNINSTNLKTKFVDKRLKKDKRAVKHINKKKKHMSKKRNKKR
ncbi:methylase [Cryptosporidium ubiquitum]|uniref:Putative rRNA methyltransferase n=1 Tax=Cryptosporidium ubiquitum TaxID=857276 RepID=A0A1J4MFB1_9CRYT|nr:methylase [Cryptosporidium ubiquitum]OII72687.1 methylase [Cryptosporidium ubiquitum]